MGESGECSRADDMTHLRRFLVLGSELGRCAVEDQKLAVDNARCIMRLVDAGCGEQVVQEIVTFSTDGRVARQQALVFALAMCARLTTNHEDDNHKNTKQAAYAALDKVCRTPTDLFTFVKLSEKLSDDGTGWGRAARRAVARWYSSKDPQNLAYLVTKYVSRDGWSHVDLLRLCHVKPENEGVAAVVRFVSKGLKATKEEYEKETGTEETAKVLRYLSAVVRLKQTRDEQEAASLIREYDLVREHIPTWLYNSKEVWSALTEKMPMTALLRNLGKMASLDLLSAISSQTQLVKERLNDKEALKKARIHPLNVLSALSAYKKGKSEHRDTTWKTNTDIVTALHNAFYLCFQNVECTNKRYLMAMDVSKSMMYGQVTGCRQLSPAKAAAAMAMATVRAERSCDVINFATDVKKVELRPNMDLNEVMTCIAEMQHTDADCAVPIRWALTHRKDYDVFIIYTDLEPYVGGDTPAEMMKRYREEMGLPTAKLVICALTSKGFTLADPDDPHMLDIAGIDSLTPAIINQFVNDLI